MTTSFRRSRPGARVRALTGHDTMALIETLARVVDHDDPATSPGVAAALVAAMRAVGTAPALVHAFEATGMLVSEENLDLWSPEELDRWQAAVEAYRPGREAAAAVSARSVPAPAPRR
jgi:hypothetical protein